MRWLAGSVLCALLATAAGCSTTAVVLSIVTDLEVPGQLDALSMQVHADGQLEIENLDNPWPLTGAGAIRLPGTFTLVAASGRPALEIEVVGRLADRTVVSRRASLRMVEGQVLFLRLGLLRSCLDVVCDETEQTCIEGACRSPTVDGRELPPYEPGIEDRFECRAPDDAVIVDTRNGRPLGDLRSCQEGQRCIEGLCSTGARDGGPLEDRAPRSDAGDGGPELDQRSSDRRDLAPRDRPVDVTLDPPPLPDAGLDLVGLDVPEDTAPRDLRLADQQPDLVQCGIAPCVSVAQCFKTEVCIAGCCECGPTGCVR